MSKPKLKLRFKPDFSNSRVTIALILAIVVALNWLLTLFPLRWDVSANKRFSLSPASKTLVREIDDLLTIKGFISQKLPAQYQPLVQEVKDLLWEYQNAGRGKLNLEYYDPSADTDAAQKANALGIYPVQFSDISQEKLEVSQGYFGVAISYAEKSEAISFVDNASNLEYQISLAISNLTRMEKPGLAFITGHEEKSITSDLTITADGLGGLYSLQEIALEDFLNGGTKDKTPALVIVDPQTEYSDKEKYLLDQWLMGGKAVLALLEGANVQTGLQATKSTHNLSELFAAYGATLNSDLVLDAACELASFSDGRSSFYVAYPFWPKVSGAGFNQTPVITNRLESAVFAWSSSLTVQAPADVSSTELVKSGARSWTQKDTFDLDPTQDFAVPVEAGSKTLAVLLEGKLPSYYKGKALPEGIDAAGYKEQAENARLIVAGDATFVQDRFVSGQPGNYVLLANMIDYLSAETALTEIRAKGDTYRPLEELSSSTKQQVKYLNIFGPLVVLAAGGWTYNSRRKRTAE